MAGARISQAAEWLDVEWNLDDPVSLQFTVADVDWTGTYVAQIRASQDNDAELLATFVVTATLVGADTAFTLTLADSTTVPRSGGHWSLKEVGGVTRLIGRVIVLASVST